MPLDQTGFDEEIVFDTLGGLIASVAELLKPPEKLTASEYAEQNLRVKNQIMTGRYSFSRTEYAREILDCASSLDVTSIIFVAPAQVGKTDMALAVYAWAAAIDPRDMQIVEKSQTAARDFSIRRLDRFLDSNDGVKALMRKGRTSRSLFTKLMLSGMFLSMSWPSVNELAGRPQGIVWLSDYDRMPSDIGGEGSAYSLAIKRITTFLRRGKIFAESSPSKVPEDFSKIDKGPTRTPHSAPDFPGILALYNAGDRRLWYWQCTSCRDWFEPNRRLFDYPDEGESGERAAQVTLCCPHCNHKYTEDGRNGSPTKHAMNQKGRWVPDGQHLDKDGILHGKMLNPGRSRSYWLKGPAAGFAKWEDQVKKLIDAEATYERTGDWTDWQATINADQGEPFFPPTSGQVLDVEILKARAVDFPKAVVPSGVRYLTLTIDTQNNRWVCQLQGHGEDGRIWIVDRFTVRKSKRTDDDGDLLDVSPPNVAEDWRLLEDVADRTWPLADGSGEMIPKLVTVDGYGNPGVTNNAYNWYRRLQRERPDLLGRVFLTKGEPKPGAKLCERRYPDSGRSDRNAGARGEIPILFVGATQARDIASARLERATDGPSYITLPKWAPDWWYLELTSEERQGAKWAKIRKRNEAWDLLCYAIAISEGPLIDNQLIDWKDPPMWAETWDKNSLVLRSESHAKVDNAQEKGDNDMESWAASLNDW